MKPSYSYIHENNKHVAVALALRSLQHATISQLVDTCGYSRNTIVAILNDLIQRHLVQEDRITQDDTITMGRPASTYSFHGSSHHILAISITGENMSCAIANLHAHILATHTWPVTHANTADHYLQQLINNLNTFLARRKETIHRICVSTTGIIDADAGTVVLSDFFPQWNGYNLRQALERYFHIPVSIENNINMAAYGECSAISPQPRDLMYVHVDRAVNTGLILDGDIWRGRNGEAGEIGNVLGTLLNRDADNSYHEPHSDPAQRLHNVSFAIGAALAVISPSHLVVAQGQRCEDGLFTAVTTFLEKTRKESTLTCSITQPVYGQHSPLVGAIQKAICQHLEQLLEGPVTTFMPIEPSALQTINQSSHTTSPSPMNIAFLGFGARGQALLKAINKPDNHIRITHVCDPRPDTAQRLTQFLDYTPHVLSDPKELDFRALDAVIVTTPDYMHEEHATLCLEHGVAVYCEKPLDITAAKAQHILQSAYDNKAKLYVGHNMRHMYVIQQLRRLITQGEIGQVKAIWCRHFVGNGGDYYFKDWHAERKYTTGLLLQKACHDIDVMHWLADGYTDRVVGMGELTLYNSVNDYADNSGALMEDFFDDSVWPPRNIKGLNERLDVEDLSMITMHMNNGVYGTYQQCHYTPDYWRNYTIIGDEGRIENFGDTQGGEIRLWRGRSEYRHDADLIVPLRGDAHGHNDADQSIMREFVNYVRHDITPVISPISAWHAVATGEYATRSVRSYGQPQDIPSLPTHLLEYFSYTH